MPDADRSSDAICFFRTRVAEDAFDPDVVAIVGRESAGRGRPASAFQFRVLVHQCMPRAREKGREDPFQFVNDFTSSHCVVQRTQAHRLGPAHQEV